MPRSKSQPPASEISGYPLAEVFGFGIEDNSDDATVHRNGRLCPFHNKEAACTKNSKTDPLGVCSIVENGTTAIVCPVRFRERWKILGHASEEIFGKGTTTHTLSEVRLRERSGKSAGNIDYVITKLNVQGQVVDFASIEVQGVYISGNVTKPFRHYMANRGTSSSSWSGANPSADYLSSSRKRLAPQLLFKGGIFNSWNKKSAVVMDLGFFNTLPAIQRCSKQDASLIFLVYDLRKTITGSYDLQRVDTIYANFETALAALTRPDPGDVGEFTKHLQKLVNSSRNSPKLMRVASGINVVVNEEADADYSV